MDDDRIDDVPPASENDFERDEGKNVHAAALSALGSSKGGKARAAKLSPEERAAIARQGAETRWSLPKAAYGSPDRPLRIGDIEFNCYVLDDERRVLSQRGVQTGIGMSFSGGKSGERRLATFVAGLQAKGIATNDLTARIESPIPFIPPGGGRSAYGFEATILPEICEAVLEARIRGGILQPQQEHIARRCEVLVRGLARVGIIALVDEATGYQDARAHDALSKILEKFIAKELRPWVSLFPPDFYKQMFRLRGWEYSESTTARPRMVGKLTDNIIYKRLAPGVRDELRRIVPRDAHGRLKAKLFQRLTEHIGIIKLRELLSSETSLMTISETWDQFMQFLDRVHPEYGRTMMLPNLPFPEAALSKEESQED